MSSNEKRSMFQIAATTLLAIAIAYLAYGLQSIASVVPEIISFLDKNNYQLSPAIKEVSEIRRMIPEVLAEIRDIKKLVPSVTLEMAKISDPSNFGDCQFYCSHYFEYDHRNLTAS